MPQDFDFEELTKVKETMTRSERFRPTLQTFTLITLINPPKIAQHRQTNAVPCLLEPRQEDHIGPWNYSLANFINLTMKPSAFTYEVSNLCVMTCYDNHDYTVLCVFSLMIQQHCVGKVVQAVTQARFSATLFQSKSHY